MVSIFSAFDVAILGKDLNLNFTQKGYSSGSHSNYPMPNAIHAKTDLQPHSSTSPSQPSAPALGCKSHNFRSSLTCSANIIVTLLCFSVCSCMFFACLLSSDKLNTHNMLRLYFLIFSFWGIFVQNTQSFTNYTNCTTSVNSTNSLNSVKFQTPTNSVNFINSNQMRFKIYYLCMFLGSVYTGEILCHENEKSQPILRASLNTFGNISVADFKNSSCDVNRHSRVLYFILIGISVHILLTHRKKIRQRWYLVLNLLFLAMSCFLAILLAPFSNVQTPISIFNCLILVLSVVVCYLDSTYCH